MCVVLRMEQHTNLITSTSPRGLAANDLSLMPKGSHNFLRFSDQMSLVLERQSFPRACGHLTMCFSVN